MFKYISLMILSPLLMSCTALDAYFEKLEAEKLAQKKQEEKKLCTKDWYNKGHNYALLGGSSEAGVSYYQDLCAPYNLDINVTNWNNGYKNGLVSYCAYETAYQVGLQRNDYNASLCTTKSLKNLLDLKKIHQRGLTIGQRNYQLDLKISSASNLNQESREIEDRISNAKQNNQGNIQDLKKELHWVQQRLNKLESQIDDENRKINRLDTENRSYIMNTFGATH